MIDEEIAELRKLASETWGHPGVGLTYSQAADLVALRLLAGTAIEKAAHLALVKSESFGSLSHRRADDEAHHAKQALAGALHPEAVLRLLDRLEAAERALERWHVVLDRDPENRPPQWTMPDAIAALNAWRTSKGAEIVRVWNKANEEEHNGSR